MNVLPIFTVTNYHFLRIIIGKKYMKKINSLQPECSHLKAMTNGFFAFGIVSDYRADWALANDNYQQLVTDSHNPGRNPR